ncbi:MAG: CDP-alcohol phosphatidyltransferase family protein, partial [Alphaproteobacteria bacterium]|nr:CDP-alcohol phosphatidyltransferase family protein [Alphaproteobacteria bacterium]
MLRYLADPANLITAAGLLISAVGLHLVLSDRPELAVAAVLWSMLADQLDGVVARRTMGRPPDVAKMGKSLDGFADIVYGAVFPAIVVLHVGQASFLSLLVGAA